MAREIFEIRIDHIGSDGLGVGQGPKGRISVPGVATGDIVEVQVEHKSPHRSHAWGRVRRVIERGGEFVRPACHHAAPVRGQCGGCPLMHVSAQGQAQTKHRLVEEALSDFPGYHRQNQLQQTPAAPPEGLTYRNRAIYTVFRPNNGNIHLGSRSSGGSGFAKMSGCRVNAPVVESVAERVAEILNERNIPLYPARSGVRYVVIRANKTGDALVELICAQRDPGWLPAVLERLREHPAVRGIMLSVNRKKTNAYRVETPQVAWGEDHIVEQVGGLSLKLTIDSFLQLNTYVAEDMYREAALQTRDAKVIWDLYCGVGGLGLSIAQGKEEVRLFGCEITESAVHLARTNADENKINGHFQVANLRRGAPRRWPEADLIAVNPPRRGLDDAVHSLIRAARPREIVYMSCSTASLNKDLKSICAQGYRIAWHGGWDMLPQTEHVEVLVVLDRMETRPNAPRRGRESEALSDDPADRAARHRRRYARKKR